MIKAVVFDLWKTIGTKNISISSEFCKRFGIEKTEEFMPKYEASIQLDRWKSVEKMAEGMLKHFELEVTDDNVSFIVGLIKEGEKGSELFPGMKELLVDIHKTCKIGLLSNTAIFESHFLKDWGVEDLFDAVVYSWQINSLKPAHKNFEAVLEKLDVDASECVFVDDNEKNRMAAEMLGMDAINPVSVDTVREELHKRGLKL